MHSVARAGMGAIAVVAAIALAGCAPAVHSARPTASPSSTPTPTAGPSRPSLSKLVVTPDGLGYLIPGVAVPSEPAATAIVKYNPTKCVSPEAGIIAGAAGAGAWVPAYPDGLTWSGSGLPFDVGPVTGPTDPIHQIEIWSPELKTSKGIGAGSAVAKLTAAYGSSLSLDAAENSDVYILTGAKSELLFEVAKAAAGLPVEETGTVVWMRIVPLGTTGLHIANTDVAGACAF
jgi:hypothetical protein